MTPVSQASAAAQTTAASAATTQSATAISSDFETFLKMLTTQIQNQDPLNPMESQEFAVQLATFSGVEQQVQTNSLLTALGGQLGVMGMAQMSNWVGMEARAAAPVQFDGTPVTVAPVPVQGADRAELIVRDENGTEVQRSDIAISADPVEWAGVDANGDPLPSGQYTFELESYKDGTLMATTPVEVYSRITEVRSENGQTVLVLTGGVRITVDDVSALREPGASL